MSEILLFKGADLLKMILSFLLLVDGGCDSLGVRTGLITKAVSNYLPQGGIKKLH